MRPFETGKNVLLPSSQIHYEQSGVVKPEHSGMLTRTSIKVCGKWGSLYRAIDSDGNRARFTALVKSEIGTQQSSFSSKLLLLLVMLQNRSRPMDIVLLHVQYA